MEPKNLRWAVYYGAEARPEVFDPYDLVVLESFGHPPLQPLRDRKKGFYSDISASAKSIPAVRTMPSSPNKTC